MKNLQLNCTITWETEDGTVEETDFEAPTVDMMIEKLGAFERDFNKGVASQEQKSEDYV